MPVVHLPAPPAEALRVLRDAGNRMAAEEAWAAQQAANITTVADTSAVEPDLPRLHALLVADVLDAASFEGLAGCVRAICNQWRAPPECTLIGWFAADDELAEKVEGLLAEARQFLGAKSPFLAYSDGPARAVRCELEAVKLADRLPFEERLQRLLELVPSLDTSWVLFSEQDGLWHPGRTAFFRNFARQVPGPPECLALLTPVIARPTAADADAPELLRKAIEVNRAVRSVGGSAPRAVILEERSELVQFCLRRQLLADILAAPEEHLGTCDAEASMLPSSSSSFGGSCLTRLRSLINNGCGSASFCREVPFAQFKESTPAGESIMWMYYSRRLASVESAPPECAPERGDAGAAT